MRTNGTITLRNFVLWPALMILLIAFPMRSEAQYSTTTDTLNCIGGTTTFVVDLSASPDSVWISPPQQRAGSCCGTDNKCVQFSITLAPGANGINFGIPGGCGATPTGSLFYQVDCGPLTSVGTPICLSGSGPFTLTFCKPGNNENCYMIQSIPAPSVSDDVITADGCMDTLSTAGLIPATILWNSIFPGNYGDYNQLLSNPSGTLFGTSGVPFAGYETVIVQPGFGAPSVLQYEVCGTVSGTCISGTWCDTVAVYIYPELFAQILPEQPAICAGGSTVDLIATPIGGAAPYTYVWTTTADPLVNGSTSPSVSAGAPGEYSVQILDATGCSIGSDTVLVTEYTSAITVDAGQDMYVCAVPVPLVQLQGSSPVTGVAQWSGYQGTFSGTDQDLQVDYIPSSSELAAGFVDLVLTSLNNYTCPADSDTVRVYFTQFDALTSLSTQDMSCFGVADGSIDLTISGGAGPFSFNWSNGGTSEDIAGLTGNQYDVVITDMYGCTDTLTANIAEPAPVQITGAVISDYNGYQVSCFGSTDGTIDLTVAGGTIPYTYSWSSGNGSGWVQGAEDQTGLSAGTYSVTVTDAQGCQVSTSYTLNEPAALVATAQVSLFPGGDNISCFGANDGFIDLTVSGGVSGYAYQWSTSNGGGLSANAEDQLGLIAGAYDVTVTDLNGCMVSLSNTLTEPTPLTPTSLSDQYSSGTNISCNGASDGAIDVTVSGGSPAYTYSWTTGNGSGLNAGNEDQAGLTAGDYVVTVTDVNGCQTSLSVTLIEPSALMASSASSVYPSGTNISCNGANDGSIDLSVSGGNPGYTYVWTTSNGSGLNAGNEDQAGLTAGDYAVSVTDVNGCQTSLSVTLIEPSALMASSASSVYPSGTNISCNGANDGSIDLSVSGGNPGYTYVWATGNGSGLNAGNEDQAGLTAGDYAVSVTDVNGCQTSLSVTLIEPSALMAYSASSVYPSGTNISCNGASDGSIDLSVSGGNPGYTYVWATGNGSGLNAGNEDQAGLTAGDYAVTVTDLNGCLTSFSVTLIEPSALVASSASSVYPSGTNISCNGASDGSIDLSVSGGNPGYTYVWTTGNGSGLNAGDEDQTGLTAGDYAVSVTDVNGCQTSLSVTLIEPSALSASSVSSVYPSGTNISCNGANDGSIDLSVSGGNPGYTYSWTTGNGSGLSAGNEDQTGLTAGDYAVSVTDVNGCQTSLSVTLIEPSALSASSASSVYPSGTNISCNGANDGSIDLSVSGGNPGYTYSWTTGNGSGLNAGNEDQAGLTAGDYAVTVADVNGCQTSVVISLVDPAALALSWNTSVYPSGTNISCNGATDGSIIPAITGGNPGYSYSWSTVNGLGLVSSSADQLSLGAGDYDLVVTDINGCVANGTISLVEPDALSVVISSSDISCKGFSNGTADATVTGGNPGYIYNWSTTDGNGLVVAQEDQFALTVGMYTLEVTDINGCQVSESLVLSEPDAVSVSAVLSVYPSGDNISCNGMSDGFVDIQVSGGTPGYTFSWGTSGGSSVSIASEDQSGLTSGTYLLTITDGNGCTMDTSFTLGEPQILQSALTATQYSSGTNISCAGLSDGAINLGVTGGSAGYSYAWTSQNGNGLQPAAQDQTGLMAGTYTVLITDLNGCTSAATIDLVEPAALVLSGQVSSYPSGANISCYGLNDGSIDLSVLGGNPGYSYTWSTIGGSGIVSGQEDQTNLTAGLYTVEVTDVNGCSEILEIELNEPAALTVDLTAFVFPSGDHISCWNLSDGSIDATVLGGSPGYTFDWTSLGGGPVSDGQEDQSGMAAGTYQLWVTDANGCEAMAEIELIQPSQLSVNINIISDYFGQAVSCTGSFDGEVEAQVTGGSPAYTFLWNTTPIRVDAYISQLGEGTYQITVTDVNGCTATDVVELSANPLPEANPWPSVEVCAGEIVQFGSEQGANEECVWSLSNGMVLDFCGPHSLYLDPGCYDAKLLVTNVFGCRDSAMLSNYICVHEIPQAALEANTHEVSMLDPQIQFTNLSSGTNSVFWDFGDGSSSSSWDAEHTFPFEIAGTYEVTLYAYDDYGCSDTARTIIEVLDELLFYVPNAFTPDGNEHNNTFSPVFGAGFDPEGYHLLIFNRWGETLFESMDPAVGWDGTYHGDLAQDGTYVWKMVVRKAKNTVGGEELLVYSGHVNLLR